MYIYCIGNVTQRIEEVLIMTENCQLKFRSELVLGDGEV